MPATGLNPVAVQPPKLDVRRHTKYHLRCLKSLLPGPYTSNDSNRMSLAFFVLAALDLLDGLVPNTTESERADYIDWIYRNQHPTGGFRAFPGTDVGDKTTDENAEWDPAHLPATYFALTSLLVLGDDLGRVHRRETLRWLGTMQRTDGSFGETVMNGTIEGGYDSRFGYCGAGVRYILRGHSEGSVEDCDDIDADKLLHCVRLAETYDGGLSEAPYHEAQAGYTFCGIAILSFLDRLPSSKEMHATHPSSTVGLSNPQRTIRWLASRQTATISEDDDFDTNGDETDTAETCHDAHSFVKPDEFPSLQGQMSYDSKPIVHYSLNWTGINGRCNKIADTCYAFWVMGALSILSHTHIASHDSLRRWLLEQTSHQVMGGFGKHAGDLPDVYHSYLGLAALSLIGEEQLKPLDATMCVSQEAKGRLVSIWKSWGVAA